MRHPICRWFDLYVIELTKLIVRIRGNLSKLERKVIVALVTTDVHARDIIDELYENKVPRSTVNVRTTCVHGSQHHTD